MAALDKSRNQDLAGKSVKQGGYTVTYDDRGYFTSAVKDGGRSAKDVVETTHANDSAAHQEAYQAAQRGDWDAVGTAVNKIGMAGGVNADGTFDMGAANKYYGELVNQFGYNAKDYYDKKYDQVYGAGSSAAIDKTGGKKQNLAGGQTGTGLGNGYPSFEDFLAGTGYDQYADSTQAVIKAAVQNAVNGYRDQIDTTNQDSDELARQAYIAKMLGQKNLDQQMAANGYAGGMADSQRIATETDYQNRLGEIEKQRQATVKELESAITNAQLTGDMQTAQELADYLQTIQGQWMDYVQFQQSLDNQNYWNQQNLDNQNYWNQQNLDAQNTESARSWAMQQMAKGILPDDETLAAAGISKQAAQQQVALVLGETGAGTVTQAVQQAVRKATTGGRYNNGSLNSSQVMQLQKALGVTADGMWGRNSQAAAGGMTADQAWAAYQGQGTMDYNTLRNRFRIALIQGRADDAKNMATQYWESLSDEQRNELNALTQKYYG